MELLKRQKRFADWRKVRRDRSGYPERMQHSESLFAFAELPLEQFFVTNREERAAQRREHRQLVVGPFNRRERRTDRFDFLPIVKRFPADEDVAHAARLE